MSAVPAEQTLAPRRFVTGDPSAANGAGPEVDGRSLADLVAASGAEVAERAHEALAPVVAHDALVLVAPGAPGVPVQIAAPPELRERLAAFDWSTLVDATPPLDGGVARLALPDLSGG